MNIPVKKGAFWPKPQKPMSPEATRKAEALDLISALTDAAIEIGARGIIDDYTQNDFHLYPEHIAGLLRDGHPLKEHYGLLKDDGRIERIVVPWPFRTTNEPQTTNELRERPFEILGLLMRKVLDGDTTFFETVADTIREGKRLANKPVGEPMTRQKRLAGKVVTKSLPLSMIGDSDWFTRIREPLRRSKIPHAIWSFCKRQHQRKPAKLPTRREIRDHLERKGLQCSNLRIVLGRMNLGHLEEGARSRKRNI
jgi:hypothetical protein